MIPAAEELEKLYPADEVRAIEALRAILAGISDPKVRAAQARAALRKLWDDELTYLSKTHWIRTKQPGVIKLLQLNYAQKRFYEDVIVRCRKELRPIRGIVLKARQLGFSTFIQSWQYEQCDRSGHRTALTLSYDEASTRELFAKAKFVHRNLWFPRDEDRDSRIDLEFSDNNSIFFARTSGNFSAGRGDTFHHLHCSELPMWQDAGETLNSVLQAVPLAPESSVFFESTAKGAIGQFYDDWRKAERGESDFVPFFAPWFWDPAYALAFPPGDAEAAFARSLDLVERRLLEKERVTFPQLNWRRYAIRNLCQGSESKFRQEYPSTAAEAFLTSGAPVFNADAIANLEENATRPMWKGHIHLEV